MPERLAGRLQRQRSLAIEQSECSGNGTGVSLTPNVHWSTNGRALHVEDTRFRGNQSVCAYLVASSAEGVASFARLPGRRRADVRLRPRSHECLLRKYRAQQSERSLVVTSVSSGQPNRRPSGYYDLSLRDTVPFEVDGALAIDAFIE